VLLDARASCTPAHQRARLTHMHVLCAGVEGRVSEKDDAGRKRADTRHRQAQQQRTGGEEWVREWVRAGGVGGTDCR
jgi:hypothetical protein